MKISRNTVAKLSFFITDEQGQVIDRTRTNEPVETLIGSETLVPGLEQALHGHEKGDEFTVTLNPKDAYGEYEEIKVQTVDKSMFGDFPIEVGSMFEADDSNGDRVIVIVKEIKDDKVILDGNHPYAGKTVTFNVVIEDVREATEEEKAHGHVHTNGVCPSEMHSGCGCHTGGCGCHSHEEDHECCGGHGHEDDHECCGGHGHHHHEESGSGCCGGGHGHGGCSCHSR